jgi:hypothetical protein
MWEMLTGHLFLEEHHLSASSALLTDACCTDMVTDPAKVLATLMQPPYLPADKDARLLPNGFVATMRACLHTDPARRPSFEEIVDRLNDVRKTGPDTVVPVKEGRAYTGKSTVFAYQSRDPVTIEAPMGKRVGRKGCFVVDMRNGDAHVFSPAVFQDIYEPVQGALANEYRRKGCVHAVHMKSAYAIKTDSPAAAGEAVVFRGRAGEWLVQQVVEQHDGSLSYDTWIVPDDTFTETYTQA